MARDTLKVTIVQETGEDGALENVNIDLFEHLQGSQNQDSIFVVSDIRLPKGKKRPLPNFSTVFMDSGIFDTGDWCIGPESVLPIGASELICLHSISSIGDLMNLLPESIQIVRVRNSIFNNIGKKEDVSIAKSFIELYPDVVVYDERGQTLTQKVLEKTQTISILEKQPVSEINSDSPKVALKTSDWVSADEFIAYVKAKKIFIDVSDTDLKRYFQQARSKKSGLNIESQIMLRTDNQRVACIKKSDVDTVVGYIKQLQQQKADKDKKKVPAKKKQDETTNVQEESSETISVSPVYCLDGKEVAKTKIKKYFTKKVKKQIPKNAMLDVLKTIKKVNINPGATKGENVFYIDDNGDMCSLPTLEFKTAKCLCQALPNNNAARIVWALKGDIMVAINFFKNHGGDKEGNVYKQYIRNITDKDVPNIDECISVEDLIKEMYDGGDGPDTDGADDALKTSKKEHKKAAETKSENVLVPKKEETAKKETTDVAPVLTEEKKSTKDVASDAVEMVKTVVPENTNTDEKEAIDSSDAEFTKNPTWVDIASIAGKIIQEYELTSKKITRVERGICETQDVKKKFKLATVLVDLLGQQVDLKEKMQELERINKTLEDFQADLAKAKYK